MSMNYRFRLRIAAKQEGKFEFDAPVTSLNLPDDLTLELVARNADTLAKATTFHFEAGGFACEELARIAGERLRVRLRLLNAILGLGINVPTGDSTSGSVSAAVKQTARKDHDAVAIDSVWGLTTFPDDGRHFEYVFGGNLNVRPSDPSYVMTALKTVWSLDLRLDQPSEEALQILGLATLESSEKAAFLTSYLALEQLIQREARSAQSLELIARFQKHLKKASTRKRAPLVKGDAVSLAGSLAALKEESFPSALMRFVGRLSEPKELKGHPLRTFLSACIDARNRIAHHASPDPAIPLNDLAAGLRQFVLGLVWTRNQLPTLSIAIPPSAVTAPAGAIAIRVL
jgi:TfoX/Sxy family transcriptional regulator of competence genes